VLGIIEKGETGHGATMGYAVTDAVIRGETMHFEMVANESARGIGRASLDTGVPPATTLPRQVRSGTTSNTAWAPPAEALKLTISSKITSAPARRAISSSPLRKSPSGRASPAPVETGSTMTAARSPALSPMMDSQAARSLKGSTRTSSVTAEVRPAVDGTERGRSSGPSSGPSGGRKLTMACSSMPW
ncbi:MAG TPA: 6,7-dimethyl-8-ribityllumazine synthase, partial [Candidatus Latescibacteria bacterium]|nr:6,7-dimethyl-8-ribityllumazine synthase [Candidatus Latescibacterota bacterium]